MRAIPFFAILFLFVSMKDLYHVSPPAGDIIIAKGSMPQVITDARGTVHLAYGTGDSIMYMASSNKGTSFSKPQLVAVLPKLFAKSMRGPQIAAASTDIIVTANNEYGNIYSFHKNAGGKWSKAVKVNDVDSVSKEGLISLGADGRNIFAVWLDVRANGGKGQRLFGAYSHDGGESWSNNMLIYASPDKSICECCKPSVIVKGDKVYAMFRNWLNGNRDLYLIKSSDGGKSFRQAIKLGTGSWKLNGCPMDGGALALGTDGVAETVWRREGNIYASAEGKPETLLGDGRSCSMTSLNGRNIYTWTNNGEVVIMQPGKNLTAVGKGSTPVITGVAKDIIVCVWENEKQIHASVVHL